MIFHGAALFDLDGTILDAELAKSKIDADIICEHLRVDVTGQQVMDEMAGHGTIDKLRWACAVGNIQVPDEGELKRIHGLRTQAMANVYYREEVQLFPHISFALQSLRKRHIPVFVGSNNKPDQLDIAIHRFKLDQFVNGWLAADGELIPKKPDPAVYLRLARGNRFNPEDCVVFEDSGAGIKAAVAAQMFAVGHVPPGHSAAPKLQEAGANKIISGYSPDEFEPLIMDWQRHVQQKRNAGPTFEF